MSNIVATYLSIRTPLLWISFAIILFCEGVLNFIALPIWVFTLIFSEYSYDRYNRYKNKYKKKEKSEYIDTDFKTY